MIIIYNGINSVIRMKGIITGDIINSTTIWSCRPSIISLLLELNLRKRIPHKIIKSNWGTICTLVQMTSEDGKKHKKMAASTEGIFRIIRPTVEDLATIRLHQSSALCFVKQLQYKNHQQFFAYINRTRKL